jgi:predicted RNA-binding Zn-ribbon protein involved in translation (DUF1610 family)
MESQKTFESIFGYRRRIAVGKDVQICIKCGSDEIIQEKAGFVCEECGAVLFFANM